MSTDVQTLFLGTPLAPLNITECTTCDARTAWQDAARSGCSTYAHRYCISHDMMRDVHVINMVCKWHALQPLDVMTLGFV